MASNSPFSLTANTAKLDYIPVHTTRRIWDGRNVYLAEGVRRGAQRQ